MANTVEIQVSTDGSNWSAIYHIDSLVQGVMADFMHWIPPGPGNYYFRAVATSDYNALDAMGRTAIVALALNR